MIFIMLHVHTVWQHRLDSLCSPMMCTTLLSTHIAWQHRNANCVTGHCKKYYTNEYCLVLCSILREVKSGKQAEYKMDSQQIILSSGKIPEMKLSLGNMCFLFCFERNSHQSWSIPLRGLSGMVGQDLILLFVFRFQSH